MNYLCKCHGKSADKPALVAVSDWRERRIKSDQGQPVSWRGLGKWRCSITRQRCTVTPNAEAK